MGMGVISDEEFERQYQNVTHVKSNTDKPCAPNTIIEAEVIDSPSKGRKEGDNNLPESGRNLLGITANIEGRKDALQLAKALGISPSSASAYANGATSTKSYNEPKKELVDVIKKSRQRATKKALTTLHSALDNISEDKLSHLDAKDLASISKDMASVVKQMDPSDGNDNSRGPLVQFQLFAPAIKSESSYDSIQVND